MTDSGGSVVPDPPRRARGKRSGGTGRDRSPAYRRLAREWERCIHDQVDGYGPGHVLPPADRYSHELGVGADTVREAYALLEAMGLVSIRQGYGVTVRSQREREVVHVPAGTSVEARMPTFAEADEWSLEPGVPMLVAGDQAWPADRYELVVGD